MEYSPLTIVIDLDKTLIYTSEKTNINPLNVKERSYIMETKFTGHKTLGNQTIVRNYTYEFLEFCNKHFDKVVIWSAGTTNYVRSICTFLFRGDIKPDLILTAEQVTWEDKYLHYKVLSDFFDLKRTVILDDNKIVAEKNPDNLINIKPFSSSKFNFYDKTLINIQDFIEKNIDKNTEDVTEVLKRF